MSPLREASLTALREIRRNLASAKGIVMFVFFFLGGSLWAVLELVLKITGRDRWAGLSPEQIQVILEEMYLSEGRDVAAAHYLSFCPPQLVTNPGVLSPGLFQGAVTFAPLLILLIGFDQIAGDIQFRAVRYIAGRSRRETIVAGKALGLWAVTAFLMLVLNIAVWILVLARGGSSAGAVLTWGPRLWLFQVITAAPWVGLIALISSCVRTPIIALLVGVAVFPTLWITNKILGLIEAAKPATWALPFRYEELLLSPEPVRVLSGVGAFLGWGALMLVIATLIMKRRDV